MGAPPNLQVFLIILGAAAISSKPYFDLGDSYEDMMRSVGRSQQEMRDVFSGVRRGVEGLGREAEELGDRIASDMDQEFGQLGARFGQWGHGLGDQFDLLGGHLDNLGQGLNSQFEQMGDFNLGGHLDSLGQGLNSQFEQMGNLNFNLGHLAGPGLLDHFHSSIGGSRDPFGHSFSGFFGRQSGAWWQGENVCKATEVDEEEDMGEGGQPGPFTFHMEVHSCTQTQDSYVCTHKKGGQAGIVTKRTIFSCCSGHRLVSGRCAEVEALQPLEETMEQLGGGEFLELLVENDMASKLHNVTVFLHSNEAVEDWKNDLGEGGLDANTVYRVDEGLLGRRRRSFTSSLVLTEGPSLEEVVSGHVVPGIVEKADFFRDIVANLKGERILPSFNDQGPQVRVTRYSTKPETVMANCAKVTSTDHHASDGVVHTVDKVMQPAKASILDTLQSDSQFSEFLAALEAHGFAEDLAQPGSFTVFAPTNEAMASLDEETRAKLAGGSCGKSILRSHILVEVICAGAVQAGQISVTSHSVGSRKVRMERDGRGQVTVEGVNLIFSDQVATNGVIHVVDDIILTPDSLSLTQHLEKRKTSHLLDLIKAADLTEADLMSANTTSVLLPSEAALAALGQEGRQALLQDKKALQKVLLHHVVVNSRTTQGREEEVTTAAGTKIPLTHHEHPFSPSVTLAQCAQVTDEAPVCGGYVATVDNILLPPTNNLMAALARDHSEFSRLIEFAGIDKELRENVFTVLAPTDDALAGLGSETLARLFGEKAVAEQVVRAHLLPGTKCCASVPTMSRLRVRSHLGSQVSMQRNRRGGILADTAELLRCDSLATNGLIHSINNLVGGRGSFWQL